MANKPYEPTKTPPHIMDAFQSLEAGCANETQQKAALHWLINGLCRTYDLSFRPGGMDAQRDTDFAEGRRAVGLEVVLMLKLNTTKVRELEEKIDELKAH